MAVCVVIRVPDRGVNASYDQLEMWRLCDLHTHTVRDDAGTQELDTYGFVSACVADRLDVVAVTDHDRIDSIAAVAADAPEGLSILPGVEVTTDRGHMLVISPEPGGIDVLTNFLARLGISPGDSVILDELLRVARTEANGDTPYGPALLLIGAHVDKDGSLLASTSSLPVTRQLSYARELDALEVVDDGLRDDWTRNGVKQSDVLPIVQSSDRHGVVAGTRRSWMYLPSLSAASFRHAFATPEASIAFADPPTPATVVIRRVTLQGGSHEMSLEFCDRVNAIIGPPSSGKSLVIDALRWALDQECEIADLKGAADKRLKACLPDGSRVTVDFEVDGRAESLTRVRGASERPRNGPPAILFSQNELTQRAIESRPSIALLDIHVPDVHTLKRAIDTAATAVERKFDELVELARRAASLKATTENAVDGLEATRAELVALAGVEATAQAATDAERVRSWRRRVVEELEAWRSGVAVPVTPTLPPAPGVDEASEVSTFCRDDLSSVAEDDFRQAVEAAADALVTSVTADLDSDNDAFVRLQSAAAEALGESGLAATHIIEEVNRLRTRLAELSNDHDSLENFQGQIDSGILELSGLVDEVDRMRLALRSARKSACTGINASIRTFFVKLDYESEAHRLDEHLVAAKVGTYFRDDEVPSWRNSLDRARLLTVALRTIEGRAELVTSETAVSTQDRVSKKAVERGVLDSLRCAATLWPGDSLAIQEKPEPGAGGPIDFVDLTEGLRALAIKEVSFASSYAPVISDQPEDAVPSQRVFESLVPTVRNQRASRQFIVTSHDANLVVAGDADVIWVLDSPDPPYVGDLSSSTVREAAIRLLEGGEAALRQRTFRYGNSRYSQALGEVPVTEEDPPH